MAIFLDAEMDDVHLMNADEYIEMIKARQKIRNLINSQTDKILKMREDRRYTHDLVSGFCSKTTLVSDNLNAIMLCSYLKAIVVEDTNYQNLNTDIFYRELGNRSGYHYRFYDDEPIQNMKIEFDIWAYVDADKILEKMKRCRLYTAENERVTLDQEKQDGKKWRYEPTTDAEKRQLLAGVDHQFIRRNAIYLEAVKNIVTYLNLVINRVDKLNENEYNNYLDKVKDTIDRYAHSALNIINHLRAEKCKRGGSHRDNMTLAMLFCMLRYDYNIDVEMSDIEHISRYADDNVPLHFGEIMSFNEFC